MQSNETVDAYTGNPSEPVVGAVPLTVIAKLPPPVLSPFGLSPEPEPEPPDPGGFTSVTSKKSSEPSITGDSSTLDAFLKSYLHRPQPS